MKVILMKDINGLGLIGDTKNVKDGYARNYLIPKKLALIANDKNMKVLEDEKRKMKKQEEIRIKEAHVLREKLEKVSCTITAKVGEEDKMFGSITNKDIQVALVKEDIKLDKKDIVLKENIKELGVYTIDVKLHPEVIAKVKVWIVKE